MFVDELHEIADAAAHHFEQRHDDVLPPPIGFERLDQRHLCAHQRNRFLLLQQRRDFLDLIAQPLEPGLGMRARKLQAQDQQAEAFGLLSSRGRARWVIPQPRATDRVTRDLPAGHRPWRQAERQEKGAPKGPVVVSVYQMRLNRVY